MSDKIFLIQSDSLGRGDEKLGLMLMASFLRLLGENKDKPSKILFWNSGVKLVCENSQVLDHLKKLEGQGIELLACTTCLEYFDIKEKQKVGQPTTMIKSIASMMSDQVVTI